MGGGLGTQPASHHTREKIPGGPTGQDFPAPSLPAPRPWGRKGRGSPLPPRGLRTQLLICVPGDRKHLEVPLQDGSLPGEGAVLPQSPTATVKSLRSHSISLVRSLSLPSAPGHPGQRLDRGWTRGRTKREKAHQDGCSPSQGTSSLPASSRPSVWLLHSLCGS